MWRGPGRGAVEDLEDPMMEAVEPETLKKREIFP
jgi:hypothetical protein